MKNHHKVISKLNDFFYNGLTLVCIAVMYLSNSQNEYNHLILKVFFLCLIVMHIINWVFAFVMIGKLVKKHGVKDFVKNRDEYIEEASKELEEEE